MTTTRTRTITTALVVGLLATVIGVAVRPQPPELGAQSTGDQQLADDVRTLAGDGHLGLSVARITDGEVEIAGVGAADSDGRPVEVATPFEIGSMTKALVGQALAELAEGDVVAPSDAVADVLGADLGDATLEDLATHRSGLPSVPPGVGELLRGIYANFTGSDPYGAADAEDVIAAAAEAGTTSGSDESYSNLGFALLGHALADAHGASFEATLSELVLEPLAMTETTIGGPPSDAAPNHLISGRVADAWSAPGYHPAGVGVWSTAEDVASLLTAVAGQSAPGMAALEPRTETDASGHAQGLGWAVREVDDRSIAWHNGGTSGSRSFMAVEPDTGDAVVVLGNTTGWVDAFGWQLMGVDADSSTGSGAPYGPLPTAAIMLVGVLFVPGSMVLANRKGRADRARLVAGMGNAVLALALARWGGAWEVMGWWPWTLAVGITGATAGWWLAQWAQMPTAAGSGRSRWFSSGLSVAASTALTLMLVI